MQQPRLSSPAGEPQPQRRPQIPNPLGKRPRPPTSTPSPSPSAARLNPPEDKLYKAIRATEDAGAWIRDLRQELNITAPAANKSLKILMARNLVKEVKSIQFPTRKLLMASEFTPSKEMSGGSWYSEGSLDTELITQLRQTCLHFVREKGINTCDKIASSIASRKLFDIEINPDKIGEILRMMTLDGELEECISTGIGEFAFVIKGSTCYRVARGRPQAVADAPASIRGLAAIPCGVCPRINECTLDGLISPRTCVYYDRW